VVSTTHRPLYFGERDPVLFYWSLDEPHVLKLVPLLFLYLRHQKSWVVNATPRPLYVRERNLVSILLEVGWAPGLNICNYTPSLTPTPEGVVGQCHAPAALFPTNRLGTYCIAGWKSPGLRSCTYTHSVTSAPEEVGGQSHATAAILPRNKLGTDCFGS